MCVVSNQPLAAYRAAIQYRDASFAARIATVRKAVHFGANAKVYIGYTIAISQLPLQLSNRATEQNCLLL